MSKIERVIKRVVKFETPDGILHDTHAQAQTHISRENAIKELEDWIVAGDFKFESEECEPNVVLRNFLVHNAPYLSKILGRIK